MAKLHTAGGFFAAHRKIFEGVPNFAAFEQAQAMGMWLGSAAFVYTDSQAPSLSRAKHMQKLFEKASKPLEDVTDGPLSAASLVKFHGSEVVSGENGIMGKL
eukprot:4142733-Pyramimonas_sp.AAC.1